MGLSVHESNISLVNSGGVIAFITNLALLLDKPTKAFPEICVIVSGRITSFKLADVLKAPFLKLKIKIHIFYKRY